jgi:hypothetical protein
LSFGDVNNNVTCSIGKINEEADRLESDLAAAQATIEKQRKVIEFFAHHMGWCSICDYYTKTCHGSISDDKCTAGIIAYAEKQVEEGK